MDGTRNNIRRSESTCLLCALILSPLLSRVHLALHHNHTLLTLWRAIIRDYTTALKKDAIPIV